MSNDLKAMAQAVRRALAEKNLIDARLGAPDPDTLDQETLAIARTFADSQEETLSKRAIVAVATDKAQASVVVYTKRAYAKADQNKVREGLDDSIPVIFRSLDLGAQGPDQVLTQALQKPVLKGRRTCCGSSISLANDRGAGTMGALVRDRNNRLFGLSCSHVIAGCGYMQVGMPILAPGVQDVVPGWPEPRVIGRFARSLPLVAGDPQTIGALENIDAALLDIANESHVSSSQADKFDTPVDVHELTEDDEGELEVEKVGRTTGHTTGKIQSAFDHALEIEFKLVCYPEHGQLKKFEAIVYSNHLWLASSAGAWNFAARGDSGALVVTKPAGGEARRTVGLIVAGTRDGSALVLPIRRILNALDVELVGNHGV